MQTIVQDLKMISAPDFKKKNSVIILYILKLKLQYLIYLKFLKLITLVNIN